MNLIKTQGVCSINYFPYSSTNYTSQPTTLQTAAAALYKASNYYRITGTSAIKTKLYSGYGVVIAIHVNSDFNITNTNQIYDDPSPTMTGSHSICLE